MSVLDGLHVATALDGAGWHPAAWREAGARPAALFTPEYWTGLVGEAERGLLDFVTFDDALALQSSRRGVADDRVDRVRGRLDAVLTAARVAPTSTGIGLVPVATTTHTEPFHASKAVATLDYISGGRAGVQARVSATALEAGQFGRRTVPDLRDDTDPGDATGPGDGQFVADLFDEAADFVEVMRRLWDSWEDGAEIRDVATGRFVDRDKLHPIDFEGRWFSVRGPSITPRPPQGQPVVAVLAHVPVAFRLAARCADVVFVTPRSAEDVGAVVSTVRAAERAVGRSGDPLRVFIDLMVFLDDEPGAEVTVVVGSDVVGGLTTWHDQETLRDLVTLAVVGRPGVDPSPVPAGWRAVSVPAAPFDLSSTELRRRLEDGEPVDGLVPEAVIRCIHQRGLYATGR